MGNEMGNNNTSGILQESDDATTEVQEKSLQQAVRNNDEKGENHAVPASENTNIDEKERVLAYDDLNGSGDDHVPDKSSNEEEPKVKGTDPPAANHKSEMSVDESGNDKDSDSHNKLQKQVSFSKESDDVATEAQEVSLQHPVRKNNEKGENQVVLTSENKNIDEKETVLASEDSTGTGDDHARNNTLDGEEPNVMEADLPVDYHKTEMRIDEDGEIKSTALDKELEDHKKCAEPVTVSNEDHLETSHNQLQKQASITKAEVDGMSTESCVTTPQLQNLESQVLMETNFDKTKITEIHSNQSERPSSNREIKVDDDQGSSIANSPVKENGLHIDTCFTNIDETFVSGTDIYVEEKKEELSVTTMKSTENEMQSEEKSEGIEGELMSTTIISLNSASDEAEKCDGQLINVIKNEENNYLELHPEFSVNSQNSLVEDLPEDKRMVLTEETKLVKKDSQSEANKQDNKYAQSNEELDIESNTDETNVPGTDFLLCPDGKNKKKEEPDSISCNLTGDMDFHKQANVADSGHNTEATEENSNESEEENVNISELEMLPPEQSIPCRGENADEGKDTKKEEPEEFKDEPEAAFVNEKDIKESENIDHLKFQNLPVHSEPSPSASLFKCQDSQLEPGIVSNDSQSSSKSALELKPEIFSELPDTKPTNFHGRSLTVEFLAFAFEKPMQVAVSSVSANPETLHETTSSPDQSIDRHEFESSLLPKDSFAEAAESAARSSTESNPTGFNAQMRKSPSFSLDLQEDERSKESDRIQLLYHNKSKIKSSQSDATVQYPLLHSQYVQQSLENQTMELEEKVITLERSDSEKSRTPFLGFLKQNEEDHTVVTPKKQDNQGAAKNATSEFCKSVTNEMSSTPAKLKEKHNKRRSSLFTNCMCCTTVIN